ncbi:MULTISPECIES: HlyC/CorC family transporter [unclassified Clostridioides]|uniref:HlyC/CorC family transporter n=1 Tax=unclassified Clostridioides TaxID=2635829 RepID=UPI001D0C2139|nr:HlyC/CorC family transporter [Clostridioides sp. ES-S-0001-02]MCC0640649.1 HlyC/CorC family transporter [Clostridioides sp. ES-S-0049-03]MCC0651565.1 HlyC/CorC family transporter [Clostridioides sp. ES-S-0001-03]MCC0657371.1 HlyC/CorC family transporter [Clostridioides sp. ES-S-0123-01]MCC0672776.1 HlyC/CorC family transporter [Clostridioides sp. ES-S-0145-01]MCC0676682.1 HlyC/CorC family transporter [Clostridioides sp. ES-W-0018-02]MCC0678649.1 HlyC/CorC family transporter [Clostridioides
MLESPNSLVQIIILVVLLMGSAFFSASETALMSLSKIRIRYMQDEGVKGAKLVSSLIESPNKLLSSILVGNNVVNIAATSISTSLFIGLMGEKGVAIATAVMTVLVLIFGEITPKTIAASNSEKVSLLVSKPIRVIIFVLRPVVWVFNIITNVIFKLFGITHKGAKSFITEEELKTMVNVSHEEGVLEMEEREIINNVFEFGDMQAKNAMIQRIDMVAIDMEDSYDEIIQVFKEEKLSRMPVYEETVDDIIGILNIKDIIFLSDEEIESFDIKNYMREPFFTYEFKKITQLLEEMKLEKSQMAIVVDEYGGTSGLLTIEDLVEVIVGDIEDEYDEEEDEIQVIKEDEYIVDGSTKIGDVNELIGVNLESEEFDSIGGFIIGHLSRLPEENEVIEVDNIRFCIESIEKNRIKKIRIYT